MIEFLKILPGIALFPFSFYLLWKKFGYKVHVSASLGASVFTGFFVKDLILVNKKDKPLILNSIYLLWKKHTLIPILEFDPPLIIKALEAIRVDVPDVSGCFLSKEEFKFSAEIYDESQLFIISDNKQVECKKTGRMDSIGMSYQRNYSKVIVRRDLFNNHIFNDLAKFSISYRVGKEVKTGFLADTGFIGGGNWDLWFNHINLRKRSVESITAHLNDKGIMNAVDQFWVSKINRNDI